MPSALSHDPSISTPGASTDNAIVIFDGTGGTGFGNSTILVDSGGNGRIGIAADTDIITVTAETVTIAGKVVATSLDIGDGDTTIEVTQSNHNLTVGMPVRVSGANQYAAARATTAALAEVVGIVTAVASSSAFTLTLAGEITTAAAVPDSTSPGDIVYLSTTLGAVTTTEPSAAGEISKPLAVITEANNKMIMLPFRGEVISTGSANNDFNGAELILDVDGDTSITADTDDQIDVKISGADDFRFTANNFHILSGSTLTVDSGATITNSGTANGFGGGAALTGSTNNTITTVTGTNAIQGEANLLYASPALTIQSSNATAPQLIVHGYGDGSTDGPGRISIRRSVNSSIGGNGAVTSGGDNIGIIEFAANDGNSVELGAAIRVNSTENWSDSARGNRMRIFTTANGSTSQAEALRLDQDRSVYVYEGGDSVSVQGGLAKAFVRFRDTTLYSNWNVSSITDYGTGDRGVNLTNGMATADNHSIVCVPKSGDPTTNAVIVRPNNDAITATAMRLMGIRLSGAAADPSGGSSRGVCCVVYGVF